MSHLEVSPGVLLVRDPVDDLVDLGLPHGDGLLLRPQLRVLLLQRPPVHRQPRVQLQRTLELHL